MFNLTAKNPYRPSATLTVRSLSGGNIPYIELLDLLAFKVHCCGLRGDATKRTQDATDAVALLGRAINLGLSLSDRQKNIVKAGLPTLIETGLTYEEAWDAILS
jgi:hypothetical protein